MSQAQLDVGDAGAHAVSSRRSPSSRRRSCCRSRSSAGASRSPRRSRSTARPAPTRCSRSPSRAASASRRASGSSSIRRARGSAPARARKYKTGGARLAHRARRADPAGRAQRRLSVAEGTSSASVPARSRCRSARRSRPQARTLPTLTREVETLDRGRSRAPRRPAVTADATGRVRGARRDSAPRRRRARPRRRDRASVVAGRRVVDYRLVRARRRTIGMEVDSRRPHRARAALGDDPRDRGGAARARRLDRAHARRVARAAPRRACRASGSPARRSSTAAASWRSRCSRARRRAIARRPLRPDGPPSRPRTTSSEVAACVARWLRDEALRTSSRRASPTTRADLTPAAPSVRFQRAQRMGKLQPPRARSGSTGGWCSCRLRSPTTSSRTRSRTWSSSTTRRGSGRVVETLLPGHAALRRELDEWTALLA